MDDLYVQLMRLKELTEKTQIMHDAQIIQLKTYPMVMISNATKVRAEIDINNKMVEYHVDIEGEILPDIQKRCMFLSKSVKDLLGESWLTKVLILNTMVYSG